MQFYVDARHNHLKLSVPIVIGTIPLRECIRRLPAPQLQTVITDQTPSAPPSNQPDSDNFDLRMSSLIYFDLQISDLHFQNLQAVILLTCDYSVKLEKNLHCY